MSLPRASCDVPSRGGSSCIASSVPGHARGRASRWCPANGTVAPEDILRARTGDEHTHRPTHAVPHHDGAGRSRTGRSSGTWAWSSASSSARWASPRNIGAGFKSLAGGEVKQYTRLVEDSRRHALDRMIENAQLIGGDGIVSMRFDSSEVGQTLTEIVAYGTAVVSRRRRNGVRRDRRGHRRGGPGGAASSSSIFASAPRRVGPAAAGWHATDEVFNDPSTKRLMRVWLDAQGDRHYVPRGHEHHLVGARDDVVRRRIASADLDDEGSGRPGARDASRGALRPRRPPQLPVNGKLFAAIARVDATPSTMPARCSTTSSCSVSPTSVTKEALSPTPRPRLHDAALRRLPAVLCRIPDLRACPKSSSSSWPTPG